MANNFPPIQFKRTSVSGRIPTDSDIAVGEIAINLLDRKIFTRNDSDIIIELGMTSDFDSDIQKTIHDYKAADSEIRLNIDSDVRRTVHDYLSNDSDFDSDIKNIISGYLSNDSDQKLEDLENVLAFQTTILPATSASFDVSSSSSEFDGSDYVQSNQPWAVASWFGGSQWRLSPPGNFGLSTILFNPYVKQTQVTIGSDTGYPFILPAAYYDTGTRYYLGIVFGLCSTPDYFDSGAQGQTEWLAGGGSNVDIDLMPGIIIYDVSPDVASATLEGPFNSSTGSFTQTGTITVVDAMPERKGGTSVRDDGDVLLWDSEISKWVASSVLTNIEHNYRADDSDILNSLINAIDSDITKTNHDFASADSDTNARITNLKIEQLSNVDAGTITEGVFITNAGAYNGFYKPVTTDFIWRYNTGWEFGSDASSSATHYFNESVGVAIMLGSTDISNPTNFGWKMFSGITEADLLPIGVGWTSVSLSPVYTTLDYDINMSFPDLLSGPSGTIVGGPAVSGVISSGSQSSVNSGDILVYNADSELWITSSSLSKALHDILSVDSEILILKSYDSDFKVDYDSEIDQIKHDYRAADSDLYIYIGSDEFSVVDQTQFTLTNKPLGQILVFRNGIRVSSEHLSINNRTISYNDSDVGTVPLVPGDYLIFDYNYKT